MMKYKFTQFWFASWFENQILVDDYYGGAYLICNEKSACTDYGNKTILARRFYKGARVRVVIRKHADLIDESEDDIYIEDEVGNKIHISLYEVLALLRKKKESDRYTFFREWNIEAINDNE